jgi:hypothetical protein
MSFYSRALPAVLLLSFRLCSAGVPAAECFSLANLAEAEGKEVDRLLLQMLDREALFTLVGGMKPISSGFVRVEVNLSKPDLEPAEKMRQRLGHLSCGPDLHFTLHHFATVYENKRILEGVVWRRSRVQQVVARRPEFFGHYGLTPASNPMEVLMAFEYERTPARNMGYGYLFGYPDYAVEFFGDAAWQEIKTRKFVARDFRHMETFSRPTGYFTYAVPKGSAETEEDRSMKACASAILTEYRERRARFLQPDQTGAAALLRDWLCEGGNCDALSSRVPAACSRNVSR